MAKFSRNNAIFSGHLIVLLSILTTITISAKEFPPVGERVYLDVQEGKYGSLEIRKKARGNKKQKPAGAIFRDPQLGEQSSKTTVTIEDKKKHGTNKSIKKNERQLSAPKKDGMNKRQLTSGARNEEATQQNASTKNKKSIVDLGALKISGRHKQPTIPFDKIPIHLEQSYEPLNKGFINKIDDKLPGL